MPGGVPFSRPDDDEDEVWDFAPEVLSTDVDNTDLEDDGEVLDADSYEEVYDETLDSEVEYEEFTAEELDLTTTPPAVPPVPTVVVPGAGSASLPVVPPAVPAVVLPVAPVRPLPTRPVPVETPPATEPATEQVVEETPVVSEPVPVPVRVNVDTSPTPVLPVLPVTPPAPVVTTPPAPVETVDEEERVVELDGVQVNTHTGEVLPPSPSVTTVPVVPLVAVPAPKRVVTDVGESWNPEDLLNDTEESEREKRAEKKGKAKKKAKSASIALTDRDLVMFQFLARYRFATYPQLARYFDTTPVALRQRVPRLGKEGLLVRKTIGKSQHGVWLLTDYGMKVSQMDLPTPTLSWATAAHTLGLVDVGIMYELEGEQVVTEREIRAADQRDRPSSRMQAAMKYAGVDTDEPIEADSPRLYVVSLGGGESTYGHIPDMVLVRPNAPDGSPGSVAIELELVHKPATQWRKVLRAYLAADNIGEVIYYTPQRKIAVGIAKAAQDVGAEHMVTVRRFTPSESSSVAQNSKD